MPSFYLEGVDPSDPTPAVRRQIAYNRGSAGGSTRSRDVLLIGNKVAGTGSSTLDGLGSALEQPILIGGGEQEVIDRFGYHSELLLEYKTFVKHNKISQVYLLAVPPGTGSGTFTWTFATNASAPTAVVIEASGESVSVGVASGDTPTIVAAAVAAAINAQLHWTFTASAALGVVTVTSAIAGTRHDYVLGKARASFTKTAAMTVAKSAVTPASTDDDFTNAIVNLDTWDIYYHVNPKVLTAAATSTDNGIGEHLAAMTDWVSAQKGKSCVLITGQTGTVSQATTVAVSLNKQFSFHVHAEDSDWSPGMIATMFAGILAKAELSDRAPNLAGYGVNSSSDTIYIPDPFDKTDRPTASEIKTQLNNGVTSIGFTSTGRPFIVWYVTTYSLTNNVSDYRSRPGHIPGVEYDLWETIQAEYLSVKQPKIADDPKDGEKPLPGFTYPKDVKALIARCIDLKCGDGGPATLDPSQRDAMKASIVVERQASGFIARVDTSAVRHNLKGDFLLQDVSPSI